MQTTGPEHRADRRADADGRQNPEFETDNKLQVTGVSADSNDSVGKEVGAAGQITSLVRIPSAETFLPSHRVLRPEGGASHPTGRLFFLHGFFGSGRNWSAIARGVLRTRPDWEAVLVDLRLHGDSGAAPPPHTVEACADDVARLALSLPANGGPSALLGHSFGGKVALIASDRITRPCVQAWVIDSTPSTGVTGAGAREMMRLLGEVPGPFFSRRDGADAIEAGGFPRFVAEWMATNLVRIADGYAWRFDVQALDALLRDFFSVDLWKRVEQPPDGCEYRFVRASDGSIMSAGDTARIERLESEGNPVHLDTLEGGHWLNVDNPGGLISLLRKGLPRV
ncbi:MAG: alpha/beta hydrolase [marine benthic group bacterium]|nr:alpha/beta hydrolase [Gemmatimonadota bacterium]